MIEGLGRALPAARIKTDAETLAVWGRDWTRSYAVAPSAVVFPETVAEVAALVRLANEANFALVPSGGRTGLSGGAVASNGEVVVSFDRMNRILGFSPADRLVRCQAGVVTAQLQAYARQQGLFYPVDFASAGASQLGGNIATNAGGIKVIRYGATRQWIGSLTVVAGTGEVLELGRGLVKDATGTDLKHLFIGSEGTLGFIVEAEAKLAAPPPPRRVMVLGLERFRDVLKLLPALQGAVALSAFEFFSELALAKVVAHRALPRPFAQAASFYVLLEFDADGEEAALGVFETALDAGWVTDGVVSRSEAQAASLWALREGITESIAPYTPYKNDLAVRVSQVPAFLADIDRLVAEHYPDLEVCWFGHIGDGNLHLNILKPPGLGQESFYRRCHAISPKLFAAVRQRGGSISAEHGVGLLKRDFLEFSRSAQELDILRALKTTLDPNGVMNPGKLLP